MSHKTAAEYANMIQTPGNVSADADTIRKSIQLQEEKLSSLKKSLSEIESTSTGAYDMEGVTNLGSGDFRMADGTWVHAEQVLQFGDSSFCKALVKDQHSLSAKWMDVTIHKGIKSKEEMMEEKDEAEKAYGYAKAKMKKEEEEDEAEKGYGSMAAGSMFKAEKEEMEASGLDKEEMKKALSSGNFPSFKGGAFVNMGQSFDNAHAWGQDAANIDDMTNFG